MLIHKMVELFTRFISQSPPNQTTKVGGIGPTCNGDDDDDDDE